MAVDNVLSWPKFTGNETQTLTLLKVNTCKHVTMVLSFLCRYILLLTVYMCMCMLHHVALSSIRSRSSKACTCDLFRARQRSEGLTALAGLATLLTHLALDWHAVLSKIHRVLGGAAACCISQGDFHYLYCSCNTQC